MKRIQWRMVVTIILAVASPGLVQPASPPQLLNYQGVLRDANGIPLSGDYPMVFRLVDGGGSGDYILIDDQTGGAAGSGVTVVDGLFSVQIGSGVISDGNGAGSYTSLAEVFRDFDNVLLEIEVNGEILSPSIPIASAAYALNSTHLDGLDRGKFLRSDVSNLASGNIWFSGSPTGSTINDATVLIKPITANANETLLGVAVSLSEKFRVDAEGDTFIGSNLHMANGVQMWDNGFGLQVYAGDQDTDDIFLRAGNSSDDGAITIVGDGLMELRSGNGYFNFKDDLGNGGNVSIGSGGLAIISGDEPTDSLGLYAGNTPGPGHIDIRGDGPMYLSSVDRRFFFSGELTGQSVNLYGNPDSDLIIHSDRSLVTFIDDDAISMEDAAEAQWWHWTTIFMTTIFEQLAELQEDGDFRIRGQFENSVAFDLAESFLMAEPVEPGDVVSVDSSRGDAVRLASGVGDTAVIGVVSTRPGVLLGGAPFEPGSLRTIWGEGLHEEYVQRAGELRRKVLVSNPGLQRRLDRISVPAARRPEEPGASEEQQMLEHEIQDRALEMLFEERLAPVALAGRVPAKVDAGYGSIRAGDLLTTSPTPGHAMRADDPRPGTVIGKALEGLESGTGVIRVLVMLR